ncbi:MAG: Rrf2 family transcriptional regulator [Planctomycetia bacterium]|nr:Rrf2 family transcriptional regulator [Planctomycetia bacterium]
MRISAKAEYACAAMMHLAAHYGDPQPVRVKAIAETQGIDDRFLVQILLLLKKAGLVTSVRGAAGGYQLVQSPEKITLAQIVNAIDDSTFTPPSALSEINRTPVAQVLLDIWRQVLAEQQRLLQGLTLAELVYRTQDNALSYQI